MRAGTMLRSTVAATCAAGVLMLAAALGSPPRAAAETPQGWDPFTEEEHRNFRSYFHDSFERLFGIVGIDAMPRDRDAFERALEDFPPELCSAVVDFAIFRASVEGSWFRLTAIPEKTRNLLTIRIVFALAGVPWGPLGEVKPEDRPAALEAMENVKEYLADAGDRVAMTNKHCVENHLQRAGVVSPHGFTTAYAPAPIEFRMRELYESMIPFAAMVLRETRKDENRPNLDELVSVIASLERKYDLSVPGSTHHDSLTESIQSADEQSPHAASADGEHRLQPAALSIDTGKLGVDASSAVNRWPAAQKADPAWDWVRVLVFLVQSALIVQGHDPGKPDGLMGPKTMLALLAWSAASGPSWDGDDDSSKAYRWGLDGNVAHLLHGTLEALGLSPGPKDRFLGRESVTALDRWDGTFRRAGMFMRFSEDTGRDIVMNELGAGGSSRSAEGAGGSTARESADRSHGRKSSAESMNAPNGLWGAWAKYSYIFVPEDYAVYFSHVFRGYGVSFNAPSATAAIATAVEQCLEEEKKVPEHVRATVRQSAHPSDQCDEFTVPFSTSAPEYPGGEVRPGIWASRFRCLVVMSDMDTHDLTNDVSTSTEWLKKRNSRPENTGDKLSIDSISCNDR